MEATLERREFGRTPDGTAVELFTLTNGQGLTAKVMTYGAILTELWAPDQAGRMADVVLGFDRLEGYVAGHPFFGATVGRVANRIAGGRFTLGGREYRIPVNNGPNSLHGGERGFDKAVWRAEPVSSGEGLAVRFSHRSPDGDQGFPGSLEASVVYTLTEQNELRLDYTATTDQDTPVNLTNHSYFNLAGHASGDVLRHELTLAAERFTPADDTLIPTGEIRSVKGTPLDFTHPHPIGARIAEVPGGYDHNMVLDSGGETLALAARAYEPGSGRVMEMLTTEPGVQFYTANFLDGSVKGKGGAAYPKHGAFCLEAQHFPDSVHQPNFPSVILSPGQVYTQTTIYRFLAG